MNPVNQTETEVYTDADVVNMYTKAQKNLINYRKILLDVGPDEVESAPFHYLWSDSLLNSNTSEAIEGYRESAKGQYALRAFPLYALTFPNVKRDYIVLIKNNSTLAQNKLKEIENEFLSNPLISASLVRVEQQSTEVFSVDVKDSDGNIMNVRIEAYGKGASIRGLANRDRRPKIVIIDDPQDLEDVKSEVTLENDWEWFLSDVMFLGSKSRIFLIGNNLGEACILERVVTNAKQLGFRTSKVPEYDVASNLPFWPTKRTMEVILQEKEAYRQMGKIDIWMREKMCEASAEESRLIHRADIQWYSGLTIHKILPTCNIFMTIDPATSREKTSCYRAIVINGCNPDNLWFIADVPYGRWDASELLDILFDKVRLYKGYNVPLVVGIEKGMYQQIMAPFIKQRMTKENCFFDIVEIEHAKVGSKLDRVKMLGPRFRSKQIWFPEQAPWLGEMENELLGVTADGFKSLYVDLIDALAMQDQIARPPVSRTIQKNLPREAEL